MWIVYIIQHNLSKDLYIGFTSNLEQRVLSHNSGLNKSTRRTSEGKWILIYAEAYRDKKDASNREAKLKHHGSAKHGLKNRITHSLLKN